MVADVITASDLTDVDVEANLKAVGYEIRNHPIGQWVMPNGRGVSPSNQRGIVNHYESAYDAGLVSVSAARSDSAGAVAGLLRRGWLRCKGMCDFESHGLPTSHVDVIEAALTREHGYGPERTAYIDDTSACRTYAFTLADFADSGFSLRKAMRRARVDCYSM